MVVLAFDSFKGCMASVEACRIASDALRRLGTASIECPLSDGGEGFVDALTLAGSGSATQHEVTGPLFDPVQARLGWLDGGTTAIIESAQACGLGLVPQERRSPMRCTSQGVGELMVRAAHSGAKRLVVGLGGTATNDAGMGLLSALGWRFIGCSGEVLQPVGSSLGLVADVVEGETLAGIEIIAACDVNNPLFGPTGAAHVFAAQKGASESEIGILDEGLRHFARMVGCASNRASDAGAGAAGGLGFALMAMLGASMQSGAELAVESVGLPEKLAGAALCLTGEGRTDAQTAFGKLPAVVARCCREAGVPCVCISGARGDGWQALLGQGCLEVCALSEGPQDNEAAIREVRPRLGRAVQAVARLYLR